MTISLLCPTMGRPDKCRRMIQSAYATTTTNIRIFLAVPAEEFDAYSAMIDLPQTDRVGVCIVAMPDQPTGFKWNRLAELAMTGGEPGLFMLAADDMVFSTPCWDEEMLNHHKSLENKIHVYALRDSRDPDGTPHPIVSREYIEALGYFLPPIFLHWFVDSWTVEIAKANNCFTHMKDYMLIHDKPSDKGEGDETHNRIRRNGWHERDKWVDGHCLIVKELYVQILRSKIEGGTVIDALYKEYRLR